MVDPDCELLNSTFNDDMAKALNDSSKSDPYCAACVSTCCQHKSVTIQIMKQDIRWHISETTSSTYKDKLLPAKVNQIATRSGHCDGPACIQLASGLVRSLCY